MSEKNHVPVNIPPSASRWSRFWSRFAHEPEPSPAHRLYSELVRRARFPLYFSELGAPDTPEGRFEILALHVALAVRRLCREGEKGRAAAQALVDLMVADFDQNLRELGVGDLSVGKQVKRLASQFCARLAALNEAFDAGRPAELEPMLAANVYHGGPPPSADRLTSLVDILALLERGFDGQSWADLEAGSLSLPEQSRLAGAIREAVDERRTT